LIKIAKFLNYQVDFYGPISFKISKKYLKYCNFLGPYKNEEYKTLIKKYNYTILLSKYEGFPLSLAESLTYSTPIIVLDTYLNAQFVTNNKNGLLVNLPNPRYNKLFKKSNLKIMAKQINDFIAKDN
jgi:glycosyltransferase involved in cell wall biosynthesis